LILFLFIILGLLNFLEASTPIARLSGNSINSLSSGLQLQSSMSIISRALNLFFLPILGYISDINGFKEMSQLNFVLYILISFCLIISIKLFLNPIFSIYTSVCKSIKIDGSLFLFSKYYKKIKLVKTHKIPLIKFRKLRFLTIIAFIPLYISWPIVFLVIKEFPDYRGFILGSTSVINGINSVLLVTIIDPYLLKISRKINISNNLFINQVDLRLIASIIAFVILSLTALIFL
jgi:hypothetical protein